MCAEMQSYAAESQQVSRRQVMQLCSIAGAFAILPQSAVAAAKGTSPQLSQCCISPQSADSDLSAGPPGFNAAKDTQDSYQFVYPFGWQEVSVDGTDVVYKDIIEPLESASVTISKTDKASVTDFGNPLEVSKNNLHHHHCLIISILASCERCLSSMRALIPLMFPRQRSLVIAMKGSYGHHNLLLTGHISCIQVAQQLTNEVLTPRSQQAKVLGVNKVRGFCLHQHGMQSAIFQCLC